MKHLVGLSVTALIVATAAARAQQPLSVAKTSQNFTSWLRDPFREAAAVLQGTRLARADTGAVLDSALIIEVADALRRIRASIPDLVEAITDRHATAFRLMFVPDTGRRIWPTRPPDSEFAPLRWWRTPVINGAPVVGLRRLDSLNRRYHASAVILSLLGERTDSQPWFEATVAFSHYVNVPRLLQLYRGTPGTTWLHELDGAMTYVSTELDAPSGNPRTWRFTFREGRGDCPAGCTAAVNSVVDYDRQTKLATLVRRDTVGKP